MEPIHQSGLELIRAIQQIQSPALNVFFLAITSLGSEDFYFLLLPLLLWCVDVAAGARIAAVLLLSTYVNLGLKDLFALPRPFELDPSVKLYDAPGYGLPSGHAQLSVVIWGAIAHAVKTAWMWALAALLAVLIGLSRIYLGVHFPTDVLAGWLVGALLLGAYLALHCPVESGLEKVSLTSQLALATGLPLILLLVHTTEDTASLTGVMLGAGVGVPLLLRRIDYDPRGPRWQRVARFFLGVAVVFALRFGLKAISPGEPWSLHTAARFLRYAIIGLWVALGAPWLFRAIGLAGGSGEPA